MARVQSAWKEKIPVSLKVLEDRELSLKCTENGQVEFFLPKSQIEYDEEQLEIDQVLEISVPRWLCQKVGISL